MTSSPTNDNDRQSELSSDSVTESESPAQAGAPRRFSRPMIWSAGISITVITVGYFIYREQQAVVRLREIRAAVEEVELQIQALEGKVSCLITSQGLGRAVKVSDQYEVDFAMDFKNCREARDSRVVSRFADKPETPLRIRRVEMSTGGQSFALEYLQRKPQDKIEDYGEPHQLKIGSVSGWTNQLGPREMAGFGLRVKFAEGDLFAKVRYEGMEFVNGGMCDRVSFTVENETSTVWFDPAHDYLPRRQVLRDKTIDVFEFEQFRDEAIAKMRWFPSRAKIQSMSILIYEFAISKLTINPTFDDSRFQIDPATLPDGVKIWTGSKSTVTYTGGAEKLWKERQRENEEGMRIVNQR